LNKRAGEAQAKGNKPEALALAGQLLEKEKQLAQEKQNQLDREKLFSDLQTRLADAAQEGIDAQTQGNNNLQSLEDSRVVLQTKLATIREQEAAATDRITANMREQLAIADKLTAQIQAQVQAQIDASAGKLPNAPKPAKKISGSEAADLGWKPLQAMFGDSADKAQSSGTAAAQTAAQTSNTATTLANTVTTLNETVKAQLAPIQAKIGEFQANIIAIANNQAVIQPEILAGIASALGAQQDALGAFTEFGNIVLEKFTETAGAFATQGQAIGALGKRVDQIDIRGAAEIQDLATMGLPAV
jgi:hypothetical protein